MKKFTPHPALKSNIAVAFLMCILTLMNHDADAQVCSVATAPQVTAITTTSALFSWTAAPDNATSYVVHYQKTPHAGDPVWPWTHVEVNGTSLAVTGLEPGTQYEYSVQTICGSNSSSWTLPLKVFYTRCAKALNPTVLQITTTSAVLSWTGAPGNATSYKVHYRKTPFVGDPNWPMTQISVSDTTLLLEGLVPGTMYEYSVETVCGINSSGWTLPLTVFYTRCAQASNPQVADITSTTALLSWTAAPGNATSYVVHYHKTPFVGDPDWPWTHVNVSGATSVTAWDLEPDTYYEFSVQTICQENSSAWTLPVKVFQTDDGGLRIWPNPTTAVINIAGANPGAPITVLNARGFAVMTLTATRQDTRIDLSGFREGYYFIEVGEEKPVRIYKE